MVLLQIPGPLAERALIRWWERGRPPLPHFAPYAAHILTVDLSMYGAMARGIESHDRPSNRIDFAYLYYLPFCQVFTSNDRLHQRCAAPFLRPGQEFLLGSELKRALRALQEHYSARSATEREQGLYALAPHPPDGDFEVANLWDRHYPGWRNRRQEEHGFGASEEDRSTVIQQINRVKDAATSPADRFPAERDVEGMVTQRKIQARRGEWWQIPRAVHERAGEE